MGLKNVQVTKHDVIRLELIDSDGLDSTIEWKSGDESVFLDLRRLQRRLTNLKLFTDEMVEAIITRMFNFHIVFVNKVTHEVTT